MGRRFIPYHRGPGEICHAHRFFLVHFNSVGLSTDFLYHALPFVGMTEGSI